MAIGMDGVIPLPEIEHRWLQGVKARYLADASAVVVFQQLGPMGTDDVARLMGMAEADCHARGMAIGVRKRILQVVMEAVDNLQRHKLPIMAGGSFALLVRDGRGYRLATGNAVPYATGLVLADRITVLNMMEPQDLKDQYLKTLANNLRSRRGGAGLGLLTLARKSTAALKVSCSQLGPFTTYFMLEVEVDVQEGRLTVV